MSDERQVDHAALLLQHKRPIRPQPEIVDPDIVDGEYAWMISESPSGTGQVNPQTHELHVPMDDSIYAWHVRMHESAHINWSPTEPLPDVPFLLQNGCEDWRINMILTRTVTDFEQERLTPKEQLHSAFEVAGKLADPVVLCSVFAASKQFRNTHVDHGKKIAAGEIAEQIKKADPAVDPDEAWNAAWDMVTYHHATVEKAYEAAYTTFSRTFPELGHPMYDARFSQLWARLIFDAIEEAKDPETGDGGDGEGETQAQRAYQAAQRQSNLADSLEADEDDEGFEGEGDSETRGSQRLARMLYPFKDWGKDGGGPKGGASHWKQNSEETQEERVRERFEAYGDRHTKPDALWGKPEIWSPAKPLVLRSDLRAKRFKSVQEGEIPLSLHRMLTDQKVFGRKKWKKKGASIMIDQSGSMSLSTQDIIDLMVLMPGAVIAAYAGTSENGHRGRDGKYYDGEIRVLAMRGRRCRDEDLYINHGGNTVDGPALQWLAKQKGPRYWISDGYVCGLHSTHLGHYLDSRNICRRHKIKRFANIKSVMDFHAKHVNKR